MRIIGTISDISKRIISDFKQYDKDKTYIAEINEYKSKRSIEQNRLLWKLIHLIAKEINEDEYYVYVEALKKANVRTIIIYTEYSFLDDLRHKFRAVEFIGEDANSKLSIFKIYEGSSKMNMKELNELLEILKDQCIFLGISLLNVL